MQNQNTDELELERLLFLLGPDIPQNVKDELRVLFLGIVQEREYHRGEFIRVDVDRANAVRDYLAYKTRWTIDLITDSLKGLGSPGTKESSNVEIMAKLDSMCLDAHVIANGALRLIGIHEKLEQILRTVAGDDYVGTPVEFVDGGGDLPAAKGVDAPEMAPFGRALVWWDTGSKLTCDELQYGQMIGIDSEGEYRVYGSDGSPRQRALISSDLLKSKTWRVVS